MSMREKIRAQIDDLRDKIDALELQAKDQKGEKREEYRKDVLHLKEKRDQLRLKWELIKDKGEEVWGDFQEDLNNGLSALRQEYDSIKSRFRL